MKNQTLISFTEANTLHRQARRTAFYAIWKAIKHGEHDSDSFTFVATFDADGDKKRFSCLRDAMAWLRDKNKKGYAPGVARLGQIDFSDSFDHGDYGQWFVNGVKARSIGWIQIWDRDTMGLVPAL